jgi:hypothetical protein
MIAVKGSEEEDWEERVKEERREQEEEVVETGCAQLSSCGSFAGLTLTASLLTVIVLK